MINTNELQKLSIADMLALSDYLFITGKPSQIDIRIASALTYEIGQRIARLTIEESEFDFKDWLAADGWIDELRNTMRKNVQGDEFLRIKVADKQICVTLETINDSYRIFEKCKIPSTAQEAETLFKLFEL